MNGLKEKKVHGDKILMQVHAFGTNFWGLQIRNSRCSDQKSVQRNRKFLRPLRRFCVGRVEKVFVWYPIICVFAQKMRREIAFVWYQHKKINLRRFACTKSAQIGEKNSS